METENNNNNNNNNEEEEELFEEAFKLNSIIFNSNNLKYNSKEYWKNKLNMNGKIFIIKDKGFLIIHNKEHYINNKIISEHIWLAGVLNNYRNEGIMKTLFKLAINKMILEYVTIRTSIFFPNMKNWVERIGFRILEEYEDQSALYIILLNDFKLYFQDR